MKKSLAFVIAFLVAISLCACDTEPLPSQVADNDIQ